MKKRFFGRNMFWASITGLAFAGMLSFSSCDKEDDDDDMHNGKTHNISGTASGAQEVPSVTTSATGTLAGSYNKSTKSLIYTITWTALSGDATMAHFHGPASAGENAPPMETLTITTNGMASVAMDTITASNDLHDALMAGKVYYNIHTAAYPDGEIRGQVSVSN